MLKRDRQHVQQSGDERHRDSLQQLYAVVEDLELAFAAAREWHASMLAAAQSEAIESMVKARKVAADAVMVSWRMDTASSCGWCAMSCRHELMCSWRRAAEDSWWTFRSSSILALRFCSVAVQ